MTQPGSGIYLDYHSTTPVDAYVLQAMLSYFSERFGNAASRSHAYGWQSAKAVDTARARVADFLKVEPKEIIFTSGATESLNLALKGMADAGYPNKHHIVTVVSEHPAVLDILPWLRKRGFEVQLLPVQPDGLLDLERLAAAIRNDTLLVCVMWANNETGVIQSMKEIGQICRDAGVPLISDATQAAGKLDIHLADAGIDMACISAHKVYGPKGIGALCLRQGEKRLKLSPQIHGGGHEYGLRSGTLNVPGIVGLGTAVQLQTERMETEMARLVELRDRFEQKVLQTVEEVSINGHLIARLPTVSNLRVRFADSQAVMSRFRTKLAISSGSACSSAHPEPSHVLLAMGLTAEEAKGSFRVSFGVPTTQEEVDLAAGYLIEAIHAERDRSPVWQMFKKGIDLSG